MSTARRVVVTPESTELTAPYWEAAARGRVALQRCRVCGATWHPPQPTCPTCRSTSYEWFDAAGTGTVHSYTVVHHSVHPAVAARTPYVVCLVALDEGPLVISNLVGCEASELSVGLPVQMELGEAVAGEQLVLARPRRTVEEGAS